MALVPLVYKYGATFPCTDLLHGPKEFDSVITSLFFSPPLHSWEKKGSGMDISSNMWGDDNMVDSGDHEVAPFFGSDWGAATSTTSDLGGTKFTTPSRYAPKALLGRGAFGVVCSALDIATDRMVAIKKIANAFEDPREAKRTYREIVLMRNIQHDNILFLLDLFDASDDAIYMVTELMETDLRRIISSKQQLSITHLQWIAYQVGWGWGCY